MEEMASVFRFNALIDLRKGNPITVYRLPEP
jgi:hypothetical protein